MQMLCNSNNKIVEKPERKTYSKAEIFVLFYLLYPRDNFVYEVFILAFAFKLSQNPTRSLLVAVFLREQVPY